MRVPLLLMLFVGIVAGQAAPKLIGQLSTLAHEVSGTVYAIDDRTFEIRDFVYDGTGPAAYFWAGKGPVSSTGFRVPLLPSCEDTKLSEYRGQTVQVELPIGQTIADIDHLSVWCETANVNFGDVQIGAAQRQGVPASSGPSQCGAGNAPAPPAALPTAGGEAKLIGNLSTLAHEVSGTVYAVDDRTFEIRNLVYDGQGPAAYFWAGKGEVSGAGFRVPLLPACTDEKLPQYQGDTVRVELPTGSTIADIDYLSIWCETADANFGDVIIGAAQRQGVPVSSSPSKCGASTAAAPAPAAKLIGNLSTLAHDVSGTVYAVDDRTFEIRNLVYDGQGPAAYFWAGKGEVSGAGFRVPLLPACTDEKLPQYQGDTVRVELPTGTTIADVDYLSIWCETAVTNFGDVKIGAAQREGVPASSGDSKCGLPIGGGGGSSNTTSSAGGTFPVQDGYNCEDLKADEFQVRWKVDGENIDFELVGKVEQGMYMGFGVSGNEVRTDMTGSDVVIAAEDGTEIVAVDYFLQSRAQCSNGAGVCPDNAFGGNNDITAVAGRRVGDTLMVRYRRPVAASDANDKAFKLGDGERTFLSWALGPFNQAAKLPQFHGAPQSFPSENVAFIFGRPVANNCRAPIAAVGGDTDAPVEKKAEAWKRKPIMGVTDITARIGPSGGKQGVSALTPDGNSWGIAWYLSPTNSTDNDTLIPAVAVERGVTYTFRVFGGDNASNPAGHHPFYITSDEDGGLATKNPEERAKETLYAGISNLTMEGGNLTDFTATAQGELCELSAPRGTVADDFATFEEYHKILNNSCVDRVDKSKGGVLEWTVPEDFEPEVVYYQCATHRDLGFKLVVFDKGQVDMERLERESNALAPTNKSSANAPNSTEPAPAPASNATNSGCTVAYKGAQVTFDECDERDEMVKLYWTVQNGGIDTLFVAKSTGWAGLGWGFDAMIPGNAAIAYVSADGNASINDYALTSRNSEGVQPGTNQRLTQTSADVDTAAGTISGRFTRPLNADGIPTILNGENNVIWAVGPPPPSGTQLALHTARGTKSVSVTLTAGETTTGNATDAGSVTNSTSDANNTASAPICVETDWLVEHGHQLGIMQRFSETFTYCIDGLPCGTPGHLLRRCNTEGCRLVSYKEVCALSNVSCVTKSVEVSRLRHGYDWSTVRSADSTGELLELTSVSQHPNTKLFSVSRLVAVVADNLNKRGLGIVVDAMVSLGESAALLMSSQFLSLSG